MYNIRWAPNVQIHVEYEKHRHSTSLHSCLAFEQVKIQTKNEAVEGQGGSCIDPLNPAAYFIRSQQHEALTTASSRLHARDRRYVQRSRNICRLSLPAVPTPLVLPQSPGYCLRQYTLHCLLELIEVRKFIGYVLFF